VTGDRRRLRFCSGGTSGVVPLITVEATSDRHRPHDCGSGTIDDVIADENSAAVGSDDADIIVELHCSSLSGVHNNNNKNNT